MTIPFHIMMTDRLPRPHLRKVFCHRVGSYILQLSLFGSMDAEIGSLYLDMPFRDCLNGSVKVSGEPIFSNIAPNIARTKGAYFMAYLTSFTFSSLQRPSTIQIILLQASPGEVPGISLINLIQSNKHRRSVSLSDIGFDWSTNDIL